MLSRPIINQRTDEMNTYRIEQGDENYPPELNNYLGDGAPKSIDAIGNIEILKTKSLALFCSNKCPGNVIIKTYDFMRQIRENGVTVISGFHSAIERECLNILLRGTQPIIYSPARSIEGMKIRPELRKPLDEGRLLILSPFASKHNRISADRSEARNHVVAAIAHSALIPYAAEKSKTAELSHLLMSWKKPISSLQSTEDFELCQTRILAEFITRR